MAPFLRIYLAGVFSAFQQVFGRGGLIRMNAMKKPMMARTTTQGNTPR